MSKSPVRRSSRAQPTARRTEEQWAEFADLVLIIAREIQFRGYVTPDALSLSPSEGAVMRHLFRQPDSLPSQVAWATGLQRSNLSTVLRGLEEKGLVERVPHADDGRAVHIHPTERAIRNYDVVRHEWAVEVAEAADGDGRRVEDALPLLKEIADGLVRLRQES
jgi:DNA-binding MarR family transcriptional regulator